MWGSGGFRPERGNSSVPTATARWAASTPVDRINAPLDGFRPEHGNLSALTAIRRLRRPWTVLSRAWGSFAPTAHNPMGGIRPCGPNKRPSKRFSSRTRKACPRRPPFAVHGGGRTAPIMATMSATDAAPLPHSPVSDGNAFFPKRKVYGQAGRARITCNTYSVPYKRKDPKKRLSPKSPNTLIHQCITFHTFLIFQYFSLWKSVFSRN